MKKIITVLSVLLALVVLFSVNAFAATATLTVGSASAATSSTEEIRIPINVTAPSTGIYTLYFELDFNNTALELVRVDKGSAYSTKDVASMGGTQIGFTDTAPSFVSGEFAVAVFKVKDGAAAGSYDINIIPDDENTFDGDYEELAVTFTKGTITLTQAACTDTHHEGTAESHEAKAATCEEAGNIAYYTCSACGKAFSDVAMTTPVTTTTVPATGHGDWVKKAEAKDATCQQEGVSEAWECGRCHKLFEREGSDYAEIDEVETTPISEGYHKFGATVAAKDPTCTEEGNVAYVECELCGKTFQETARSMRKTVGQCESENLEIADVTVEKVPHSGAKVDMVEATPTKVGVHEHYKCSMCNKLFSDAECTTETTLADLQFPFVLEGDIVTTDAPDAELKAESDSKGYKLGIQGYEVYFEVSSDDGATMRAPTAAELGAMEIILPFPEGITKADTSKYEFLILHEKADGSIETVKFTVTDDGFKLSGLTELSPFTVSWKEIEKQDTSGSGNKQAGQAGKKSPKTGDETNIALWVVLFTVLLTAAASTVIVAKKKIKNN